MKPYDPKKIEKKWQKTWASKKVYRTLDPETATKNSISKSANSTKEAKPKFYILDMFPYPSGEGLHVGHPKGYIATDIVSRMKRMQGFNVLHPMGFDAFGLPAENYAIKMKTNPAVGVAKNVAHYKKQLEILGFDYDWSREVNTTNPAFYKWTQWIFLKLLEKGLAFESYEPVNWCPFDKTVLANEDIEDGKCERCGTTVEKKKLRQWVLRITDYADRLLYDLDATETLADGTVRPLLDWPESIKEAQRNWIGRSEGVELDFKIAATSTTSTTSTSVHAIDADTVTVFTTRPETLFGVTYVVIAPEHPLARKVLSSALNSDDILNYIENAAQRSDIDRTDASKEKTGVEIKGVKVINPVNGEEVPVWVADYVLGDYGTGAVMAVPAHDERDRVFAEKYNLPIREVLESGQAADATAIKKAGGRTVVKYKLRDWVFSRQRYWGEPIPVIHDEDGTIIPLSEKELPLTLPKVISYEPSGTGESPLATISKWVNVTIKTKDANGKIITKKGRRETNTMPQWAGSSWYYLRYMDPHNKKAAVDSKKESYWNMVDLYVGGAEHATRHLIYARFWHKFLYDIGVVSTIEPFRKLQSVGLIMAEDGRKMSKRWGNVVNPDDIVATYGADTMRLYEMFMGPFDQAIAWNTDSMVGMRRFIERVWKYGHAVAEINGAKKTVKKDTTQILPPIIHKAIKKVTEDIAHLRFNTAISTLMVTLNDLEKNVASTVTNASAHSTLHFDIVLTAKTFLQLAAPFIPHITEELWEKLGGKGSIHTSAWPTYDEKALIEAVINLPIQINGKVRATIEVASDITEDAVLSLANSHPDIIKWTEGKSITRVVFIKGKILNIIIA